MTKNDFFSWIKIDFHLELYVSQYSFSYDSGVACCIEYEYFRFVIIAGRENEQ